MNSSSSRGLETEKPDNSRRVFMKQGACSEWFGQRGSVWLVGEWVYSVCMQAMFASFIPEIMDILGTRSKYGGAYQKEHGKR